MSPLRLTDTSDGAAVREFRRVRYVDDAARWPDDARYQEVGRFGVAWRVFGWLVEPDADTEWSGIENRTERVLAVMVGDDCPHRMDPDDFERIGDLDYCASCGQIGCTHDGRDRDGADPTLRTY